MKKFNYRAKDSQGKTVVGVVEAANESQAAKILHSRGLVVFSLNLARRDIFSLVFGKIFRRVNLNEIATFTRQLSTMLTSGLTVNEALSLLKNQASQTLAPILDEVLRNVEGGSSLATALENHPKVFSRVYVALVRAGEASGVLNEILLRLADTLEKQREFRNKIKGAMIYPVIVIVGMGLVATIMMVFVIPKLLSLYQEFQAELPTPTLILIKVSSFMATFWWLILAGIIGGVFFFRQFRKTPAGRKRVDQFLLTIPLLGNLQTQIILTDMTRTLGLLVAAGISIVEALKITAQTLGNVVFEEKLQEASSQVEKGLSLSGTLSVYEEFPPVVTQIISVGEETGKMDEVLIKLSHYFESESEQMVKGLTTAIEPLIMVVLGLGVGFLIIAVILPIYNLTTQF